MRVTVHRKSLEQRLTAIKPAVATRDFKPILKGVKLITAGEELAINATNLEVGVSTTVGTIGSSDPGECVVNYKKLLAAVKSCSDELVGLEFRDDLLRVYGDSASSSPPTDKADEYPNIPVFPDTKSKTHTANYFVVGASQFRTQLSKVEFAAAKESTKFAMTGVYCEFNGAVQCVATDSKRLSLISGKVEKVGEPKDVNILIPNQCVDLILNLTKAPMGDVHVAAPEEERERVIGEKKEKYKEVTCAWFRLNNALIFTRLVEGRFPPYREVFHKKTKVTATLPRKQFIAALKQAKTGADDETMRVIFEFDGEWLKLTGKSPTNGVAESRCPAKCSEPLTINMDPGYVLDALATGECGEAHMEFVDPSRPVLMIEGSAKHLIMPLA